MAKYITVYINNEEEAFLKKLAKYDNISVQTEVQQLLSLQIREEIELEEQERRFTKG